MLLTVIGIVIVAVISGFVGYRIGNERGYVEGHADGLDGYNEDK